MKFHQLREGARFAYRGATYRKNAPLTAIAEATGRQRLIPRSAAVTPTDAAEPPTAAQLPDGLPATVLTRALEQLTQACEAVVLAEPALGEARRAQLVHEMRRARDEILARLALQAEIGE